MTLTIGSLFSGIGGIELGLESAGVGRTVWQVEKDPYCRQVLAEHWPDAIIHEDVHHVGKHNLAAVDVIAGGFPCQPSSTAGNRLGRDDPRWLWPEFARILDELRPRGALLENVPGLLSLVDERGCSLAGDVLGDLAALGYDAEWEVLSAADVGAPHQRDRIWILAYRNGGRQSQLREPERAGIEREAGRIADGRAAGVGDADRGRREQRDAHDGRDAVAGEGHLPVGNAGRAGREERLVAAESGDSRHVAGECVGVGDADRHARPECEPEPRGGRARAAQYWEDGAAVRGADGTVRIIPREAAEQGPQSPLWPVADGVPGRVARLRAIGNAVVPACAEIFGRRLLNRLATP